jgi:hypothetical protein
MANLFCRVKFRLERLLKSIEPEPGFGRLVAAGGKPFALRSAKGLNLTAAGS